MKQLETLPDWFIKLSQVFTSLEIGTQHGKSSVDTRKNIKTTILQSKLKDQDIRI